MNVIIEDNLIKIYLQIQTKVTINRNTIVDLRNKVTLVTEVKRYNDTDHKAVVFYNKENN